jgi:hypothetical protein
METGELQAWQLRCRFADRQAAEAVGLSLSGYRKQKRGAHPVSRQTELLTEHVELVTPVWLDIAAAAMKIARRVIPAR